MKTYGTMRYLPSAQRTGKASWELQLAPHVVIKAKRIFPRIASSRSGALRLQHSGEVARDLEWLNERYPLQMDSDTALMLKRAAGEHRETETEIAAILSGVHHDRGWTKPSRTLRDYQQQLVDLVWTNKRVLCTDALGLGKTTEALGVLGAPDALPALVVVETHMVRQWTREINEVWPQLTVAAAKKGTPHQLLADGSDPDVIILNYAKLAGWAAHLAGAVRTVIFDEAQQLRRGLTSQKGLAAAQVSTPANYVCATTATPVFNYAGEIHSILDIVAPDALGSREEFVREWGRASGMGDQHISVADPKALGTYLRDAGLMLGRSREEVSRELPYGEPLRIPFTIDADERELAKLSGDAAELARIIVASEDSQARWQASGELDWKLRQATGIAKAPAVAAFTKMLLESEEKVVLFGWHHAVYSLWREQLSEYAPVMYTGSESVKQKQDAEDAFVEGSARVLIMSLRAGAGLDGLQKVAKVAVFGELDWSPQVHKQGLGRLARDGQNEQVTGYFLLSDSGSDPVISQTLELKRQQAEPLVNPDLATLAPLPSESGRIRRLAEDLLRQRGVST